MKTILVVEDEPWFRELFKIVLEKAGYKVLAVSSAYDAIKEIDKKLPDALLLDIFLPGSNGISLVHEIKSYEDSRDLPIIMISSAADNIDQIVLEKYGVSQLLDKNLMEPGDIVASIKKVLDD